MRNVEGGAKFPPETPLPPRPHFCWPFWELREQMQKAREVKKRGRGRVERKKRNIIFFIEIFKTRSGPLPLQMKSVRGCQNGSARELTPSPEATVWCSAAQTSARRQVVRSGSRPLLDGKKVKKVMHIYLTLQKFGKIYS